MYHFFALNRAYNMAHENERTAAIELCKSEMKTANIVGSFDKRIAKRFKEIGETVDRPQNGRPTTVTMLDNIQKIHS